MDSDDEVIKPKKTLKGKKRGKTGRKNSASKGLKSKKLSGLEPDFQSSEEEIRTDHENIGKDNAIVAKLVSNDIMDDDALLLDEPTIPITFSVGGKVPLHNNKPLLWNHKVNLIGEKCSNQRIHKCDECKLPIIQYGRMIPCKHIFCYNCAKANSVLCNKCGDRVVRVEKTTLGSVFKCEVEKCARTYLSSRDLQAHIQHRHVRRAAASQAGTNSAGQGLHLPIVGNRPTMNQRPREPQTPTSWPPPGPPTTQFLPSGGPFSWTTMQSHSKNQGGRGSLY